MDAAAGPDRLRDIDLSQRCLEGDNAATAALQAAHDGYLRGVIASRGATPEEIDEILSAFWADCVAGSPGHPPLLGRFDGSMPIRPWFRAIVTNRWLTARRNTGRRTAALGKLADQAQPALAAPTDRGDRRVAEILRDALEHALGRCPGETLAILHLVHTHGLSRRDVAAVWRWHESKVSRTLSEAESRIAEAALEHLRAADPHLEVAWDDFVDLCQYFNLFGIPDDPAG